MEQQALYLDPATGRLRGRAIGPQTIAIGEELPPSPAEQQQMAREVTDCPVVLMLESLCEIVRTMREAEMAVEIVTAPYCDPSGIWRATLTENGRVKEVDWNADAWRYT